MQQRHLNQNGVTGQVGHQKIQKQVMEEQDKLKQKQKSNYKK